MPSKDKDKPDRFRNRKVYGAADIAALLNTADDPWDTQRARRWLKRTRAGVKRAGRIVTTLPRLRNHFPEIADLVMQLVDAD